MASVQLLTQGTLLKLLQSMNIDKQVVVEAHRSTVLQVIGIVPALYGPDLWPNHGFYIQLSDSANSTYVSLPESANATYAVGQFVHVDRLLFDHPNSVPRASGLRPLHPSRVHPCLGSPQPLIVRVSANGKGFLIQSAPPDLPPPPTTVPFNEERSATIVVPEVKTMASSVKRRFLSPMSGKKITGKDRGLMERETSTSMKPLGSRPSSPSMTRGKSRPSSPIPSKCEVPGLVAAKDENRKEMRESGIVIPSRYRQPSPVTVRKAGTSPMNRRASSGASPMSRRISSSPARRLSGGFRISPSVSDSGSKKKMAIGISKTSEVLMASGKSGRKSWDEVSATLNANSEGSEIGKSKNLHKTKNEDKVRTQAAILARRLSDVSGKQNSEEEISSAGEKPSPAHKVICSLSTSKKTTRQPPKITVHDRKWTDGSFPLDVLPNELAKLGKEALLRKNAAATAAVDALEEACSTESLLRNLSLFSDLCSSAKILSPLPTIERFLLMYDEVIRCTSIAESLVSRTNDNVNMERHKSISLWIDAALATDLEIISLLKSGTSLAKQKGTLPPLELSKRVTDNNLPNGNSGFPSKNHSTKGVATGGVWTPGKGVSETVDLGLALQSELVAWFLKFVEQALDAGFHLIGADSCNAAANSTALTSQDKNGQVAAVLSHLKRVNEWLDCVGMNLEVKNSSLTETIEGLKKKIYGFVIRHVGSAFDNSISLGSS